MGGNGGGGFFGGGSYGGAGDLSKLERTKQDFSSRKKKSIHQFQSRRQNAS